MHASARGRFGWAMYDFAAQPFFTVIVTFIFGPYFVNVISADPVAGQTDWASTQTYAGLLLAVSAPFLGAFADESGARKPWVLLFSMLCAFACAALWWATPDAGGLSTMAILALVVAGIVGAEFAIVFNNAMLPSLTSAERIGRLSGLGWAMGYAGALVALPIMLWLSGQLPGIAGPFADADPATGARLSGPFTAIWLMVFMVPFALWTPDSPRRAGALWPAVKRSAASTLTTICELPQRPNLLRYLIARMCYYDGLNAIFAFGGVYAASRFGWGVTELGLFGIIILVFGIPGCLVGGYLDDKLGARRTLLVFVCGLGVAMTGILSIGDGRVGFFLSVPFPQPDDGLFASTAEQFMVAVAAVLGFSAGPVQASSRTLIARIAPAAETAKYFGLFALSGKATSFAAPLAIVLTLGLLGDRWAYGVILVFIVVGFALLVGVREEQET
jgi:UMF1 family MFS transporter